MTDRPKGERRMSKMEMREFFNWCFFLFNIDIEFVKNIFLNNKNIQRSNYICTSM